MEMMMTRFEPGKTYVTRSPCDHDCIITMQVISRTAKTIRAKTARGEQTFRVSEWSGVEQVKPWGNYSMCPVMSADRGQR